MVNNNGRMLTEVEKAVYERGVKRGRREGVKELHSLFFKHIFYCGVDVKVAMGRFDDAVDEFLKKEG